jgi:hypothetical protein
MRQWKKATEGDAHRRWEKQHNAAAMWSVAACSDAGSWTRRLGSATGARPRSRRRGNGEGRGCEGGGTRFHGLARREAEGGSGPGWCHTVRRWGRGVGGSHPTGRRRWAGSGPRPVGAGGVVRPCRAAGSTGVREGADRRAWAHSVGRLRRMIGGLGRTVPTAQFKPDLISNPISNGLKHFQTVSTFDRLEKHFPLLE